MEQERTSFFAELSRRRVVRAAIVYLGVTFALLQFADLAFPRLDLPDWTITLVMVLSMIGLPIVLVGAWAFDYQGDSGGDSTEAYKMSPLRALALLLVIVLAAAVGQFYYKNFSSTDTDTQALETEAVAAPVTLPLEASIAVLPFVNMSVDPANEYFSDGISEELLDALAKLDDIRVVARTSSFSFKGTTLDIREIAQELNVATVLEGSVRKAGNKVRITAQLINAADGYHLWSDTYDRELNDIFAVQDEIAQSIVTALHVPLGLEKTAALVISGTKNSEAYNAYLQGLHYSRLLSRENFEKAILFLNRAIALDPTFAAPYGVLAYVHSSSILWSSPEEVIPLAVRAFETALQLDPEQGLALISKGQYLSVVEHNWVEAEKYFLKGLQDQSERSWASFIYATTLLIPLGDYAKGAEVLNTALENDPIDSRLHVARASLSLFTGDLASALARYETALAIDPANVQAASGVCTAYVEAGRFEAAEASIAQSIDFLGGADSWILFCRALLEIARGEGHAAESTYAELATMAEHTKGSAFLAGDAALAISKVEEAISWYERSLEDREIGILLLKARLMGQPELLAHPRMQAILRALHMDEDSLREMGYQIAPMQPPPT
ncbi:MAG: hypothetical protein Hals2KO_28270 [Halioglobus sp.]